MSFYNPLYGSSNYVCPIDKWKKIFNHVGNLATSRNVIALGYANLPVVNWDVLDSINEYEVDVLNLVNDTMMDQIVNFKTTSTFTLEIAFVNFTVMNIERGYKFDAFYSINRKHASNNSIHLASRYHGTIKAELIFQVFNSICVEKIFTV